MAEPQHARLGASSGLRGFVLPLVRDLQHYRSNAGYIRTRTHFKETTEMIDSSTGTKRVTLLLAALLGLATVGLAACDSSDGPMEQAGEQVDDAVEEAGDAAEDARDEVEDAVNEAQDGN